VNICYMLLICYGTRPEFIKVKSLISNLSNIRTLFTGQHTNLISTSDNDMMPPDISLNISYKTSNRLNDIISSILDYDDIFHGVSAVLVQGDTTSALAIAISAFNHKIPVIHLEAGLRTYDPEHPFPEEINRQLIARVTSIHLCPTSLNYKNLIAEQIDPSKIFIVGNTGLDNINHILSTNTTKLKDILGYNLENNLGDNGLKYVLVTLHRRENIPLIDQWFMELVKIARKYNNLLFIFPIHPNPLIQQY